MARKRVSKALTLPTPIPTKPIALAVDQPVLACGRSLLCKNTIRGYYCDWKDFFEVQDLAQITTARCLAVTPEDVVAFRDRLILTKRSPGTISRKLTALRTLYDWLIQRKLALLNPAHSKLVRAPKRGNVKKMERLTKEEAQRFLSGIDRSTPRGRRDYTLIMLGLHMGLRRSEALSVRTDQFKTQGDVAYLIFRSKGEKERMVTVNSDLAQALAAYAPDLGVAPGWLFPGRNGKPLSGSQFRRTVQRLLEAVGIHKRVGTHGLRATFISHNLDVGTPIDKIQASVGHSQPATTLGYARDLEMIKSQAPKAMEGFKANDP